MNTWLCRPGRGLNAAAGLGADRNRKLQMDTTKHANGHVRVINKAVLNYVTPKSNSQG